jgi:small ligand-binding sensory domain FIST
MLWLTIRDEERIFNDLDRMLAVIQHHARGRKPVAVFHADCGARGRLLFNRVLKEEIIQRMQHPFSTDGLPPPWLGIYGFGEYARLGGANAFHNYTTALAAIYRN